MNDETIVAIYDTPAHAELAAADLRQAGVPEKAISIHGGTIDAGDADASAAAPQREEGFWSSLFGGAPDRDTTVYERSIENGASVLTVRTQEAEIDRVLKIIESHHPIDIDDRVANYAPPPNSAATAGAHADEPDPAIAKPGGASLQTRKN